ncbi:MAG: sodium:proton antiporter [Bifidobacteriaceae bacterium]|nr:sodium:proton antiporter [Bifidobacteriaceae bacterium]
MSVFTLIVVTLVAVLVAGLARRTRFNASLVVLAVALAASFVPGLTRFQIDPHLILGIVLPPLLYSATLSSSLRDFRHAISPILRLGVGLVIVTTIVVAVATKAFASDLPLAAAVLLGAIVAPPDAVAAESVGRRVGLPRRIMTLIGGESLINDATSLTLFKVALAGVGTTATIWGSGAQVFALAVLGGVTTGLVLAGLFQVARSVIRDPAVSTVLGILLPFIAYWLAEQLHGSGVLAVVAAGFYMGQAQGRASVTTRLHEGPIWSSIDLLLEAFAFAYIGLQIRWVIAEVRQSPTEATGRAFALAGIVLAVCILVRPLYIFATEYIARLPWRRLLPRRWRNTDDDGAGVQRLGWRDLLVTSWAGMRGVVTLAAAAAVPLRTDTGELIPGQATLQLAAYTVAIGTLLLQGLTLPAVIRWLGISNADEQAQDAAEESHARLVAARAASEVVAQQVEELSDRVGVDEAHRMARFATQAVVARETAAATLLGPDDAEEAASLPETPPDGGPEERPRRHEHRSQRGDRRDHRDLRAAHLRRIGRRHAKAQVRVVELRTKMVRAQRRAIMKEAKAGRLNDTVLRRILHEFDLEEESMAQSWTNRL